MEFSGKTVEEAINNGLSELKIERENAEITVISEEVKGLFGKVKKEAVVDVKKKETNAQKAVDFINGIFEKTGSDAKASLVKEEENIVINVVTANSASIIGYRGEVLDALQNLAGAVANIGNKTYVRVVVDCEDYRAKREATLVNLAKKLADKAVRLGRDVMLEPMNPYERRVIHSTLADSADVTTSSDGKEPNRYVVIIPNVKKEFHKRDFTKPYNNDRRPNNRNREDRPYNKDRRSGGSGFTSLAREPRKKPSTFGAYLGNSNQNKDN